MTDPKHGQSIQSRETGRETRSGTFTGMALRMRATTSAWRCFPRSKAGGSYGLAEALLGNVITAERTSGSTNCCPKTPRQGGAASGHVPDGPASQLEFGPIRNGNGGEGKGEEGETNRSWSAAISPPLPLSPSPLLVAPVFLGGVLASYTVVVVVLGAGVLGAWAWQARGRQGAAAVADRHGQRRPTGLYGGDGCRQGHQAGGRWLAGPTGRWRIHSPSNLVFSQGLVEITYNCGARVTLEGPAAFDVDSPNSGILHLGKATVRTPKAADRPLFCVLSPTAVSDRAGRLRVRFDGQPVAGKPRLCFPRQCGVPRPEHWGETKILLLESRDWLLARARRQRSI